MQHRPLGWSYTCSLWGQGTELSPDLEARPRGTVCRKVGATSNVRIETRWG